MSVRPMSVCLRPVTEADAARLLAWRNSPEVSAFMYTDHPISAAEHGRWLAAALTAPDRKYWIIEDDGAPAGLASLVGIDLYRRRCEWGYYLGRASLRGRGVGTAAKFILIDHVFAGLGLHKLWSEVLLENAVAWRSDESFGFVREAHYRDHVWKAGRFHDVIGLGLLAADWAAVRETCVQRLQAKGYDQADLQLIAGEPR